MRNPGISIALATWNGATYLAELLDSLLTQTVPPLEIVACDDGSTDGTLEILRNYANHSTIPIHVKCNDKRLGAPGNFAKAMSLCRGEFIALADQDDIWHPTKLERALDIFQADLDVDLIVGDSLLVNSHGQFIGTSHWTQLGFNPGKAQDQMWETLLQRNVLPGACMVLRRRLCSRALPLPNLWMHDYWLALIACSTSKIFITPSPWQDYRQHDSNTIGAQSPSLIKRIAQSTRLSRIDYYAGEIARWQQLSDHLVGASFRKENADLKERLQHLHRLSGLPSARLSRLPTVLAEVLTCRYRRHSRHWMARILFDLLKH